jgi:hypothetical protein
MNNNAYWCKVDDRLLVDAAWGDDYRTLRTAFNSLSQMARALNCIWTDGRMQLSKSGMSRQLTSPSEIWNDRTGASNAG